MTFKVSLVRQKAALAKTHLLKKSAYINTKNACFRSKACWLSDILYFLFLSEKEQSPTE